MQMKYFFIGVLSVCILLAISTGLYFLVKEETKKKAAQPAATEVNSQESVSKLKIIIASLAPTQTVTPSNQTSGFINPSITIASIKEAVVNKSYDNLLPYMDNQVIFSKYSSECCGEIQRNRAVDEMSVLDSAVSPWNFKDDNPIAEKLRLVDPDNFQDTVIGTSFNRFAVSFRLDNEYRIDKIIVIPDYRIVVSPDL